MDRWVFNILMTYAIWIYAGWLCFHYNETIGYVLMLYYAIYVGLSAMQLVVRQSFNWQVLAWLFGVYFGIELCKFVSGGCDGERPVNPASALVAILFPSHHLPGHFFLIINATIQALTTQNAQLRFRPCPTNFHVWG